MDLLAQAKAERDRWAKIVALLEAAPTAAAAPKTKSKANPASKSYWTPQRRAEMSRKIKALQKKKPQAAKKA
jgi:hypothetical protein